MYGYTMQPGYMGAPMMGAGYMPMGSAMTMAGMPMGGAAMNPAMMGGTSYAPSMMQSGAMLGGMTSIGLPQGNMLNANSVDGLLARLVCYTGDRTRIRNDCVTAISQHKNLKATISPAPFTGTQLLCLEGVISGWQGNTQSINIGIWITERYPHTCPICYINPKNVGSIPPSTYYDGKGRINIPYLTQWNPNFSNIVGLIAAILQADAAAKKNPQHPGMMPTGMSGYATSNMSSPNLMSNPAMMPNQNTMMMSSSNLMSNTMSTQASDKSYIEGKLKDQFTYLLSKVYSNIDELARQETTCLEKEGKLKKEDADLDSQIKQMESELNDLQAWASSNGDADEEIDLEKLVVAKTVLDKQSAKEVAIAHAYDDVLYQLDNAFKLKKIDLQTYIDNVREISREQYFARAISNKIHEVKNSH